MMGNNWIEVSESLPKSEQRVLVFYKNECNMSRIEIAWVIEGWWETSWESEANWMITREITHWQPLPDAPKNKEGEIK